MVAQTPILATNLSLAMDTPLGTSKKKKSNASSTSSVSSNKEDTRKVFAQLCFNFIKIQEDKENIINIADGVHLDGVALDSASLLNLPQDQKSKVQDKLKAAQEQMQQWIAMLGKGEKKETRKKAK